jgi:3-hydroxyacyl-[acyl-carrier-protein] dehydratase
MLAGDFFTIKNIQSNGSETEAVLGINAEHEIFKGHFPGQPVVPGVCMMQMIKEILEIVISKNTRLLRADHAKFLSMIDPRVHATIKASVNWRLAENGEIEVVSSLFDESTVFLKYRAVFIAK